MKITVNFTLDIPKEYLDALREVSEADDNVRAAYFVRSEAEDYVIGYLSDNGVGGIRTVMRDGRKVSE